MKKIFLLATCFLVSTIANGTIITSTTSGGNWNTTTTWVGGIIPGAFDSVIIAQKAGVTVDGNNTCARLTVNGQTSGFGNFPTWVGPIFGNTLTVTGDIVLNGGSSDARPAQLLIDDNATANVNGDIICNATTGFRAQIDMSFGNGILNIQGTITLSSQGGILSSTTSTINLNGTSAQTLTIGSELNYNHITLNNSGTGATLGGAITTTNVTGNITVQSGILDNGGFAMNGVSADIFKVSTGATFILTGTSGFPTGFTHTLETSSTVQYSGTTQTIAMPGTPYANLTISATGTKTLGAAIDVNGVLTINSPAALDVSVNNFNINLAGNLLNSGTLNNQSNTVTFDGTTTISGSSINSFNNITISGTLTAPGVNFNAAGNWANNGTFTHNSGTVTFNGTTTISGSSATAFNNATISGSLTAPAGTASVAGNWVNNGTFTHNGGTINFNGTTTLSGTSLSSFNNLSISGTLTGVSFGNFNVAGNWNKTGTYNPNNGKVTFNGTGTQSITNAPGVTYRDLTINSTGPLSLSGNATVSGILTMTSGNINTGTDTLTLGTSISNQGTLTRTSGTIIGRFQRWINTTSSDFLFPVGMTSVYRPAIINFNSPLTGGSLTGEFIGTNPGSLGLPLADPAPDSIYNQFTEGYWTMATANGLSSGDYNLRLVATGFTSYTLGSVTHLMTRSSGGSPWTASGTHVTAVPDTAKRNNINILPAQYALGNICNPPVVNLGPDDTVCDSVLLDAGNCCTATYLWSTGETTQTIYASQPGLNLYWAEVTASGCGSARDTINVTVNTTPIVNLGPDASVCDSVLLDAGNPGASYIWSTSATTQTIYASSTGTYWVDVTNNGCTKRDSIDITVNVSPTVDLGPDDSVCDSVLLDAANPGASFVWSTSATTQIIYASIPGLNTYWVDVTNNGCTKRDSIDITVNVSPTVDLGPDDTVCDSVLLDAGNCCSATYIWSTSATTQTIYASQPGLNLYWAEVTLTGCPAVRDTVYITVNTSPTVNLGPDNTVCDSVLLDAGNPGASFVWSTSATTQIIYASIPGLNTYWVDVTDNGCTTRDSIDITVNTSPTVNLGPDDTVCDSILLDAGNCCTAIYLWSTSATTQTIYASLPGLNLYWAEVTLTGCPAVRDTVNITVNTSPTVNLGPDATVCDSVLLDAGNCCTATYIWSTSATTQTIYASSTGTYWVDVTNNGCTKRDSIVVTVNTSPTVNLGPDNTVCDSVLLDAGNCCTATYLWSTSATTQTIYASQPGLNLYWAEVTLTGCPAVRDTVNITVNTSPTVNLGPDNTVCDSVLLDAGNCCTATYLWSTSATTQIIYASIPGLNTYWVDVTDNGCTTRDSIDITVNTSPTVNLGPDDTVCDSILLDAGNCCTAIYLWSTSATTQTIYASLPGLNLYWAEVTLTGCPAVRDTVNITVNPSPTVNLGPDATVCDSVLLDAGNPGASFVWSTSATTQIIYASIPGLNTYWVDVTDNGCTTRDSIVVDVHPVATSPITGNTSVFQSTTHTYSVTLTPGYTYTWSLLQSLGTIDAGQGSNSITVTWNTTGTDTVRCKADSCGTAAPVDLEVVINGVITSSSSNFWDIGSTWTGGVAPSANDSAVIQAGTEVTVRTSSAACSSVSLNAVGFSTAVITIQTGQTLTINGNADMNGSNDVPAVIQLEGTGTLNVTGNINMNVSTADKARIIMTDGASTLNLNGNINLSSVGTLSSSATSTININGSSAQTLAMGSALVYNHININNSSNTVTLGGAITGTNVTGNIKILSGTFDNGGFSIASAGGGTDTFQVNNIATFMLMGTTGWPTGFRDVLGSTIVYGGGNQTVTMPCCGENYDTLVIAGNGTKTLGEEITVNGQLRINPTGVTLDASASNYNINLGGQFRNNGTFNARAGEVLFNGSVAQTIDGSTVTAYNNLTINNTMGGVTLSTAQQLTGTLTLTSGTLTTGGNLTLISNSSGTARIGAVTGGAMSGNFTMQRLIPAVPDWRILTPSVAGTTIADWNGEIFMSCIGGGAPETTPHFTSVYTYNETVGGTQENGWSADDDPGPAGVSLSDALTTGRGYFIWAGTCKPPCSPTTITADLTGTLVSGTQTISCSYTVSAGDADDGWNLIGNPFPSDFSWDAAASTGGVTGVAYVYNPASDGYLPLNRALPSDRDVIPSQQGFWAKASGTSGTVVIEEADKVADGMNFLKVGNNPPGFTLTLDGNGFTDITEFYFYPGATVNYDAPIDALKLNSWNYLVANLSSVSADSVDLAQNFLPELTQNFSIPLKITWIWPGGTNNYTISASDLSTVPLSTCIVLEDIATGTFTNLRVDTSYTFTMTADTISSPPRFLLHIGAPVAKEITNVSCNGASDGMAVVTGQGSGPWSYVWLNSNGDTIQSSVNINSADTLSGLPSGTYTVFVTNTGALCTQVSDTIDITEPEALSANISTTDVSCNGGSNGTAAAAAAGGSMPYAYLWNDGSLQTTLTATGLTAGNYSVTITDNNGCEQTANATINEPAAITATISETDVSCNGGSDGTAAVAAAGGNIPYAYLWNDLAATTADTAANLPAGNYSVTITDNNGCIQTANTTINEPVAVIANFSVSADTIYLSEGGTAQFTNNSSGSSSYEWDFGDGVNSYDNSPWHQYNSTGNYTIKLIAANANMCYDSVNFQITVLDYPVGIIAPDYTESSIQILQNTNGVFIEFNLKKITEVKISLYNLLGQKVIKDNEIKVQNDRIKVRFTNQPRGIYFVKVEADGQSVTGKIISH